MIGGALLEQVLATVAAATGASAYGDGLAALLRASFPGVSITVCAEDDVPARLAPAASGERCSLFYVQGSEHCLQLGTDPETASGIVVALHDEDDGRADCNPE